MEALRNRPLKAFKRPPKERLASEHPAWRSFLSQAFVLFYLLLGLVTYLVVPFLALNWMDQPFIGAFVEQTMMFNAVPPAEPSEAWSAHNQGLNRPGMQLLAIDGQRVHSSWEMRDVLKQRKPGEAVDLQVRTPDGETVEYPIVLSKFPLADQQAFFYFPYIVGLIYLAVGVWVFIIRRKHASGQTFTFFAISIALGIGLLFEVYTTHFLTPVWTIAVALTGGSMMSLVLLFPREDSIVQRRPILSTLITFLGLPLAAIAIARLYDFNQPQAYTFVWKLEYGFVGVALIFTLGWAVYRYVNITWPNDREQIKWMFGAALFSFAPVGIWLISSALHIDWKFSPILFLSMPVFPVLAGYTVSRYRLIQVDQILSQGVYYGLMSIIIATGYGLLLAGLGWMLGSFLSPDNPLLSGLVFFILAMAIIPLRERTQNLVDLIFFRGKRAYQDRLQTFSGELTKVVDLPGILRVLRLYVAEILAPSCLHVFIYDPLSDQYVAAAGEDGKPTSDFRFPMIGGLATHLSSQHSPIVFNEYDTTALTLEPDRARLILLGAQAFVPLPGRQRLSGWLALGPRLSGEPYTSIQLGFADALCDQAALAIERAQVVANMENRVREMNVLTRIAQGINITLSLDDILELVYAQTTQIIPAQHFHIMLYDRETDVYQYAFYLEKDDRISNKENHPVLAGQALEQEVIRQRRSLLTEDYSRECQRRGIITTRELMYAWMGVPLNAGAETIGALSLASGDAAVEYTGEQQSLLQAIADQVAGALVKARLLEETERRARQLTTLNDVTRQLTSTLETEPLLQSILESAVEILNCEAGSLLMVDPQTDELVFRVVIGPVATNLVNHRMPADRGVVGKSVKTAQSIIVNDVTKFPEWFKKNDETTGFVTRALLVIPLMIKDRVTGVIEVINKCDGTIFSKDDMELLSAFASQAAVAIENAHLYTMTDLALAARVEELSVMQRIDRELNTSLDTNTALRITLEWAMRQSGAKAGLVGVLQGQDTTGVRIMASQGYTQELAPYADALLPADELQLQETIQGGLPIRRSLNGSGSIKAILENAHNQAIIPIRRETNTIGLLLLESSNDQPLDEDTMNFLIRLSDHASIAISNAQLYAAVQQANLAKSDFVSFVAHELKNPMTSVKGYTELISAGAVGPITDAQANFLGTIRHNIERMNTLVSDLNDMSKIEVGRLRLDFKISALQDIIETTIRSTRKQIEEKQQTLNITVPKDLPGIWADKMRVEQVMVNLVSNAYKYTPAGGNIELSAECCPNQWDPNGASEVVHIWVKDNGIGISEEDQKKIFQKFFRADDPKTRESPGTGLGLNITKSLVEMQGGQIWFESEFRKGTTFHFTVPISEN